jgi:putative membrane protein
MYLTEQARQDVTAMVAETEAKTGAQVMTVVVGKSDSYPEAPWKAFALGAALTALPAIALLPRDWDPAVAAFLGAVAVLGGGASLALLATLIPAFGRFFIDVLRAETEAMHFAQAQFFSRGLGRTRGRLGVLILVCLFERKVVILADDGFDGRVGPRDWQDIADRMTPLLRARRIRGALRTGLERLGALLLERGFVGSGTPNVNLPDAPVQMKGER